MKKSETVTMGKSGIQMLWLLAFCVGMLAGLQDGVVRGATAPAITKQPTNQTVLQGGTAAFTVRATGTTPLHYQWWFNGTSLSGAKKSSCSKTNSQPSDAGNYSVVVTNTAGSATSSNAVLTVNVPTTITAQPQNQTANQGSTALSV